MQDNLLKYFSNLTEQVFPTVTPFATINNFPDI